MPDSAIYLIKANAALLILYSGYFLVLRNLTFYNLNRIYLLFTLFFSAIYPVINFTSFITRHEVVAEKVQVIVSNWQTPITENSVSADPVVTEQIRPENMWYYILFVFWIVAGMLFLRLVIRLTSLYKLRAQSKLADVSSYKVRKVTSNISPFSFWKSIYLNPNRYPENELSAILAHEQVHINQWHTLDILLAELVTVCYWFNPYAWFIRKAIRENLEFVTDQKVIQGGYESKAYQYSLLRVNYGKAVNQFVNHFNSSTLKKRIIMMNAKTSARVKVIRYAILLPVLTGLLGVFSVYGAEFSGKSLMQKSAALRAGLLTKTNQITLKTDTDIKKTATRANRMPEFPGGNAALNKYLAGNIRPTYRIVDRLPVFPGGQQAFYNYLISAVRYPADAKEKKLQGKVIASFFVEKDGKLSDIKVLQEAGGGLGAEAVRLLAASPAWIPGSDAGKPMRMNFVLPIVFSLDGKIKRMPTQLQLDSAKNPAAYKRMLSMIRNFNHFTIGGFGGADSARQRKPAQIVALQTGMMGIENPLYYLDGKLTDQDIFKRLNTNVIETISIYKNAEAVKRFGENASKGVISITSKTR